MKQSVRRMASEPNFGTQVVRVKVGPRQREFKLHKKLLCSASPWFRERLEATPACLTSCGSKTSSPSRPKHADNTASSAGASAGAMIWLSTELPEMFELFVLWLYQRRAFSTFMEAAIAQVDPDCCSAALAEASVETSRQTLHWNLVRLHLFAAKTDLPALQDAAMDALQDLYLRCDWEVSPSFIRFLYADLNAEYAFRLRKWAVAMVAWTMAMQGGEPTDEWQDLITAHPVLDHDYASHLKKMAGSRGANLCIKNPQLRLPANRLRSEERFFGFRQCSFHSHRSAVGEGPCPHESVGNSAAAVDVRKTLAIPSLPTSSPRTRQLARRDKEETESDESDHNVLSPVSDHNNVMSPVSDRNNVMSPVSMYIRDGFYLDV
ncbi:hypothetical protein GE09DRAFT_1228524 [Coniochaeta sp. 2T2.1]|nr:hypothetical protein GE09DRAFT_1228524 [Coniochaeta sp. 2T2.1]